MKKFMILCSALLVSACGDLETKPNRVPNNANSTNAPTNNSTSSNVMTNNATTNNSVTTVEFGLTWTPEEVVFADLGSGSIQEATITFTNESDEVVSIPAAGFEESDGDGTTEFYFRDESGLPPSELGVGESGQSVIVYEPKEGENDGGLFYFEWEEGAFQRVGEIQLLVE